MIIHSKLSWILLPLCIAHPPFHFNIANQPTKAPAIVRRHDVPDERFLEFGEQFNCLAFVNGGCGTLIAPDWILTAAHVGSGVSHFRRTVRINGQEYEVKRKIIHPGFAKNAPGELADDIALLQITKPVAGVKPVKLYRATDELGKAIVFVGNGSTGTGESGPDRSGRRQKRASTNTVSKVTESWLTFVFNAPSDPEVTELEGISGPGDSGGPCLLRKGDELYVMGVSSWNSGDETGTEGRYQTTEHYPRVSAYSKWIDAMIAHPSDSSFLPRPVPLTSKGLPSTVYGKVAAEYLAVLNGGDIEEFYEKHLVPSPMCLVSGMTLEDFQSLAREWSASGISLTCLEYLENGADITLFVQFSKTMDIGARFAAITLHFNDAVLPRMRSLSNDLRMSRD
jgi:hypothetical protein